MQLCLCTETHQLPERNREGMVLAQAPRGVLSAGGPEWGGSPRTEQDGAGARQLEMSMVLGPSSHRRDRHGAHPPSPGTKWGDVSARCVTVSHR